MTAVPSQQRTLDQGFRMPPMKPRQFQAVTIKNWTLLYQSPCGMIFCTLIAVALVVAIGMLHSFYLDIYKPSDDNTTDMEPLPMPIESVPTDINHHMLVTLTQNVSQAHANSFGTLPEATTGTGFLGASDKRWSEPGAAQLRGSYNIPINTTANISQSFIPFATVEVLSNCSVEVEESKKCRFMTFDDIDRYQNSTSYNLMAQDIDARKQQPYTALSPLAQLKRQFQAKFFGLPLERSSILTEGEYNLTNQFQWDKHEKLYTVAMNFSYLSYPINKVAAPKTKELGYHYVMSTYSSHQTQLGYNKTNFYHLGGTQYFFFQTMLRNTFMPHTGSEPALVKGYYKQFWELYADQGADPFTPIFSSLLIPLAFFLVVPMFAYQMSQEKGDGLLSLQQMMGLRYYPRFFADLLYQLCIGMVLYAIIVAGCAIAGMEFITETYWAVWLLSTLLFAFYIPVLSQLLAAFTDSGRVSSIVGVLVILVEAIMGISWSSGFYGKDVTDRTVSMWWALIPGVAPISCLSMINGLIMTQNPTLYLKDAMYFSLVKNQDGSMAADTGYTIAWSLMIGYISLLVYSAISIYIDRITPRKNGIPEHPLFFLQSLYERACVKRERELNELTWGNAFWALGQMVIYPSILLISQQEIDNYVTVKRHRSEQAQLNDGEEGSSVATSSTTFDYLRGQKDQTSGTETSHMSASTGQTAARMAQREFKQQNKMSIRDPDIEAERQMTFQGVAASNGQTPLVRLLNLCKTYPSTRYTPAKQAVQNVTYTVGENECLCLLGANGCGKTTQINMLCMLFKPTSGTAYICGKSITDRRSHGYIQSNLGVCPQFDILYPTMTIRQHLRFYARIKGVAQDIQEEHISDLLAAVELTEKADSASKKLSGGMKRRLSIAIALACKPKVLIFDEPSSGLDVKTRRELWNVIIKARQGRAVLLTTHAMEEAECLSTRIAIMATAKIRCIGTVANLQKKFGSGYQLTVCVDKENTQTADNPFYVGSVYLNTAGEQNAHARIQRDISNQLLLASCYQGQMTYVVPENMVISDLFGRMEALVRDTESGICDWGLNQTSLESVFMRVVSQSY